MGDSTNTPNTPNTPTPTDRRVDRRAFLSRMAALSAGASAGMLVAPLRGEAMGPAAGHVAGHATPGRALRGFGASVDAHPLAAASAVRPEALADPNELTLSEALALLGRGELSASELLEASLARIARFDDAYAAFNTVVHDRAREDARRVAGEWDRARRGGAAAPGLLAGIPLAIKDNYYTAGIPTTANSLVFRDFVPDFDATCVARLKAAGGIVLGKTQMGPLATTRATTPEGDVTTVNAWAPDDPSVSPGGSSSGTATAVAGRMATSGIGTQTGGSITVPSLAQGLTGLKPTMGRASLHGIIPLTYTRDHPGPLARDAKDAAIMLTAMAGPDPSDPRTRGLPAPADYITAAEPVRRNGRIALRWPTTIGVLPGYTDSSTRFPDRAAARLEMIETFRGLGARIVEVPLPEEWDVLTGLFNAVRLSERSEPFLEHLRKDVRLFGVSLSTWINGTLLGGDEYLKGQRAKLLLLRRILDDLFRDCDAVFQPSHLAFDITGLPLIAFPAGMETGRSGHELPVGAMLGGLPFAEDRLLSLVGAYQAVTEWHVRRPADPVLTSRGALRRGRIDARDVMELSE